MTNSLDLPEAPASVNFHCVTSKGWKMQWTLRDWGEDALFERTVAFIKKLDEAHVVPLGHEYAAPPAPSLGSALPGEQSGWEDSARLATIELPKITGSPAPQRAEELSFDAELLEGSMNAGKRYWKVKGGRFSKFGVTIWPEVARESGIDLDGADISKVYELKNMVAHYILNEKGQPEKVVRLVYK